ncbi:MAG: bifunctional DNA-formamidopyrimidine glycosylase/DNA-(apurinic or apyrimidinic site) lyase [Myxococcota bacterium]
MPELPEVETTRRALIRAVVQERLVAVRVRDERLRRPVPPVAQWERLVGRRLLAVERRAKFLVWHFECDPRVLVHLGMSGRLVRADDATPYERHDHVGWRFSNGVEIRLRDPRRFGLVDLVDDVDLPEHPSLRRLGMEPLSDDLDVSALFLSTRGVRRSVKALLLDGRWIVGVGNIYASEALHRAHIHPQRAAGAIGKARWQRLMVAIRETLTQAIDEGGTTLRDYASVDGELGHFSERLQVYGRERAACMRCGRAIRRVVQSGRSTYYCPGCQR